MSNNDSHITKSTLQTTLTFDNWPAIKAITSNEVRLKVKVLY